MDFGNSELISMQRNEETKRRLGLLVEDPGQVKVKSVFWLLFKLVGDPGQGAVSRG
jgi:hypothetical protein